MGTPRAPSLAAPLRIGTRGSELALWQAHHVRDRLRAAWGDDLAIELVVITTEGDRIQDRPLNEIGGKGLFVNAIEEQMIAGAIDVAVHSMKDLPGRLADGLTIACTPPREDPRDALVFAPTIPPDARSLAALPAGARVGTTSLRRAAILRRVHPGLDVRPLRGNVPTRLRRLEEGSLDVVVLAAAGLRRLGRLPADAELLDPAAFCPAAGQGILAIECRADDARAHELLTPLHDPDAGVAAAAERAFLARLDGGCQVPMGCYAARDGDLLRVRGVLGDPSGRPFYSASALGDPAAAAAAVLGRDVADELIRLGGGAVLARLAHSRPPATRP